MKLKELNLHMSYDDEHEEMGKRAVENLRKAFDSLRLQKLHVEHLQLYIQNPGNIIDVLRHLNPEVLKSVNIGRDHTLGTPLQPIELKTIFKMAQWKNLEKVRIERFEIDLKDIHHFYHMKEVQIQANKMNPDDINRIRQNLLRRPDRLEWLIEFTKCFTTEEQEEFNSKCCGRFRIPGSPRAYLSVHGRRNYTMLIMHRMN